MNDAGEVWMLVHQAAPLAGHDPFGSGEKSEAAAVSRAERDQVRAKRVLIFVPTIRDNKPEALQRVDRSDVANFNIGYERLVVGMQVAGDDFEAMPRPSSRIMCPTPAAGSKTGPTILTFDKSAGMIQGASSVK
jgi:hypothetical protein